VAIVIWILVGMALCQIRTLKRYGWIASIAIYLNILVILMSLGFIAHSPPNYAAAKAAYGVAQGPVVRQKFATYPLHQRINGVMNIVYAYGGATIFPQWVERRREMLWKWRKGLTVYRIIAELRRPLDFLKAFTYAQALIFTIYVFYGLYVTSCSPSIPRRTKV
jgi:amino acid transporter